MPVTLLRPARLVVAVRRVDREVRRAPAAERGVRVEDAGAVVRVDAARSGVRARALSRWAIWAGVNVGHLFFTSAATPATIGAEQEVPVQYQYGR